MGSIIKISLLLNIVRFSLFHILFVYLFDSRQNIKSRFVIKSVLFIYVQQIVRHLIKPNEFLGVTKNIKQKNKSN